MRKIKNPALFLVLAVMMTTVIPAYGIPAFARKYGLPCSSCHEAWPKLSNFGQTFRDNGYQLTNDRDAPIYQNPAYWPITFRTTPQWHYESNNRAAVDIVSGDPSGGRTETRIIRSGFDMSGIDIFTAGTLYKNISFAIQPATDNLGKIHLISAWVRLDNLLKSSWLNVKLGKFELDNLISEKRGLLLDNNGGFYQSYHFTPAGDDSVFGGLGDGLGVELMGHSSNSYTRYSIALVNSNGAQPNLPDGRTYDVYANFNQGFELPKLGLQRVGVYGYLGKSPTFFQTNNGNLVSGTGGGNRSFYRAGVYGLWYLGKFDLTTFFIHGQDNVFLGNAVRADQPFNLPLGAVGPSWNGGFAELHYTYNPRLILIGKYELVRMAQQANPSLRSDYGDVNVWTAGYRYYPIMSSRAGLAWLQEFSRTRRVDTSPLTGQDQYSNSFLMGFDFDF
jgi:hypothetical protein